MSVSFCVCRASEVSGRLINVSEFLKFIGITVLYAAILLISRME